MLSKIADGFRVEVGVAALLPRIVAVNTGACMGLFCAKIVFECRR